MPRNWTKELLALRDHLGKTVVCSLAPYEGREVKYAPRNAFDPSPWVLPGVALGDQEYRLTGRECGYEPYAGTELRKKAGQ